MINKRHLVLFIFLVLVNIQAQSNLQADYIFSEEFITLSKPRIYKDKVVKNKDVTLYTSKVDLNVENKAKEGYHVMFNDLDFEYKLLAKDGMLYVHDIMGKDYYFEETIPKIKYTFSDETKIIYNTTVNKATTKFRGREYVIWYKKDKDSIAPWKFTGIPGIVYEAYSTDGNASWVLTNLSETDIEIKKVFPDNTEFLPYELYPEKAYGLSEELKKQIANLPDNAPAEIKNMKEQPRTNLEIKFEWEE